ncbi:PREDICTED: S-adenosylmethionine decarboxylase proenzyme [Papilio xuthus]|uniref:S-adenosylmethionine decarboxylase proenzyme n=1 Tax=Papilio xuthus TaxID=66420 RepID=A0AAJ6Z853_PAPXU|nr:PREDICTED: S-adenosylmethionine decarboxylase proenzyme [Papilio xuthus]
MAETEIISNSESNDQFFEGVEKLIEIWFTPAKQADLRKITRQQWEKVLKIVRCEIISFTKSEQVDAYVLSESSMFVSRRRWILKTCGTTTPLRCVRAVLALARDTAGHARVHNVFYSRREFARPHAQLTPHDNFDSEVELLDSFFGDGRAYIMGPEKDCWYLYTLLPLEGTVAALEKEHREASEASAGCAGCEPDQTIEILMSDLDPAVMSIFTRAHSASAHHATKESGIDKIIPGMVIDDYLFDPCGYSMNGVAKDGCYMTIHITPERSCSYVSFESNVPVSSYDEVVARVLHAFRPGRFVLTVFATPDAAGSAAPRQLKSFSSLCGYEQKEAQYCRFSGYELHYALYAKFPS